MSDAGSVVIQRYGILNTTIPESSRQAYGIPFPARSSWYFQPPNEHVMVHERPFRVVQDLAIDASAQGESPLKGASKLTMARTLAYQACDDKP